MKEPCRVLHFPRRKSRRPPTPGAHNASFIGKGLSDTTMRRLALCFANPKTERGLRDRALFLLMSKTALRAAEVVSLRWSSAIELPEGDQAFQVRTKGGKIHIVLPGPEALAAMRAYSVLAAPNSDHVFHSLPNRAGAGSRTVLSTRGLQKIVAGWQVKTGTGRSVHPHALRHTAIQKAFDLAGGMAAQKLAGHSSALVTSRFYTRPYYDASAILSW